MLTVEILIYAVIGLFLSLIFQSYRISNWKKNYQNAHYVDFACYVVCLLTAKAKHLEKREEVDNSPGAYYIRHTYEIKKESGEYMEYYDIFKKVNNMLSANNIDGLKLFAKNMDPDLPIENLLNEFNSRTNSKKCLGWIK